MDDEAIEVMGSGTALTLTDNSADQEGRVAHDYTAVYVDTGAQFTLAGGAIEATDSSYAVYVSDGGSMAMTGGAVSLDNSESQNWGEAAVQADGGSLTLSGGKITGKKVNRVVFASDLTLSGGTISCTNVFDDAAYGVKYLRKDDNSVFNLSGAPTVVGGGIYLTDGSAITVTGALTNATPITVRMDTPGTFTSGWSTHMSSADPAAYFASGNSTRIVGLVNGEAALRAVRTLTLPARVGGEVTASVDGTPVESGGTVLGGDDVTLTVVPDTGCSLVSLIVDGTDVTASVSENAYTFTMPETNVTVAAQFKKSVDYIDENGDSQTAEAVPLSGSTTATTLSGGWYAAVGEVGYTKGLTFGDGSGLILADG